MLQTDAVTCEWVREEALRGTGVAGNELEEIQRGAVRLL